MTHSIDVTKFIKKTLIPHVEYLVTDASPATGLIYVVNNFISGHLRMRGKGGGRYPYQYLAMIDSVFGYEQNTIEVCSGTVDLASIAVDINPKSNANVIDDAQVLSKIEDNTFSRWRCDPPYNEKRAKGMYGCEFPLLSKLLKAGARVVKQGSLMFLLCAQNYQICPRNVKRIGVIPITVVPNNEIRMLNIYVKLAT
jgi:hypothetical protein